jgi:biopolymer transport protein ExbD
MRCLILACALIGPMLAQLPPNSEATPARIPAAPLIRITAEGVVSLNGEHTAPSEITTTLQQRYGKVTRVYLHAEKGTAWRPVVQIVNALSAARPPIAVDMVTTVAPAPPQKTAPDAGRRP